MQAERRTERSSERWQQNQINAEESKDRNERLRGDRNEEEDVQMETVMTEMKTKEHGDTQDREESCSRWKKMTKKKKTSENEMRKFEGSRERKVGRGGS